MSHCSHKLRMTACIALCLFLRPMLGVQWENECSYESATVAQFCDWLADQSKADNPLTTYDCNKHWCYADYKHMIKLFATKPDILKVMFYVVY